MAKLAVIFPGQGAQSVGMGKSLFENSNKAKEIFETANSVLGKSISDICFEGPEETLQQTINTQPAILTTSIAAFEALKSKLDLNIDYTAGHSLGEYAAMYTAGVFSLEDILKLISKRAELMNKAATSTKGTMAAVLGLNKDKIEDVLDSVSGIVSVANFNSPEQIVITGEIEAVNTAMEKLKEAGAKRVIPLSVSGAFHSELMKETGEEFKNFVAEFSANDSNISVITNVDAEITTNADDFKNKMPEQIYSSVYWTQTIEKMISLGVDTFVEVGPGKVLAGLNKKINSEIKTYNVYDFDSLNATIEALQLVQTT